MSDEQTIEEMEQVNLIGILEKTDRVVKQLDKSLEKHKKSTNKTIALTNKISSK